MQQAAAVGLSAWFMLKDLMHPALAAIPLGSIEPEQGEKK